MFFPDSDRQLVDSTVATQHVVSIYDLTAQMEPQVQAEHVWALREDDPAVRPRTDLGSFAERLRAHAAAPESLTSFKRSADEYVTEWYTERDDALARIAVVARHQQSLKASVAALLDTNSIQAAQIETLNVDRSAIFERVEELEASNEALTKVLEAVVAAVPG